jgi:two-component system KDP operon response regulator KdpE
MRASLPARGYDLRTAAGGEEALELIAKAMPDLVILDMVLPGRSGLEVCRRVRQFSSVPIIVLSAKGGELEKVAALDSGADDYVTKPFGLEELFARMRAVLRRLPSEPDSSVLKAGDLSINVDERRVLVAGKDVRLTPTEFKVLTFLVRNAEAPPRAHH